MPSWFYFEFELFELGSLTLLINQSRRPRGAGGVI